MALKLCLLDEHKLSSGALTLMNEYKLLTEELSHPNIIKTYPKENRWENVFLMQMELGHETLEHFCERVDLSESQCAQIMKGVFSALEYLHDERNVIHRDVKPENIVITDYDDLSTVKLIDFGLATRATKYEILDYAKCGTLLFTPPEQITNNFAYAKKADMWAAGIILFMILYGHHPMEESATSRVKMQQVLRGYNEIKFPATGKVSVQAKHLIQQLCQKSISGRFTAKQALQHPWITRKLD